MPTLKELGLADLKLHAIETKSGGSIQPPNREGVIHVLDENLDVVERIEPGNPEWKDYVDVFVSEEIEKKVVRH